MNLKQSLQTWLTIGLLVLSFGVNSAIAQADPVLPNASELARAVQEIEALDAMRSGLASGLAETTEAPTAQTMQEVCRPVGMRSQGYGSSLKLIGWSSIPVCDRKS